MRIGIDVGRATSTAVLVDAAGRVLAEAVVDSAPRTGLCVRRALAALGPLPGPVGAVAVVTDLARRPPRPRPVAVLRIAPGSHAALAPLADWPEAARTALGGLTGVVAGGSAVTGGSLGPLDRDGVAAFAARARDAGVRVFAVCAAGAPARPGPEPDAAAVLAATVPEASLSLSYETGAAGLRERENATAVNAALGGWAEELVADCRAALRSARIAAPLCFARDDGGLVSAEYFARHPVIATAPASACAARGALARTGLDQAVVVDAGARSVRCLVVRDGEPERSTRLLPGPFGVRLALGAPEVVETDGAEAAEVPATVARLLERVPGAGVLYTGGRAEAFGAPVGPGEPPAGDRERGTGRNVTRADTRTTVRTGAGADARTDARTDVRTGAGADADPAPHGRYPRLTDAARYAARADCRIEVEQVISAAGRAELDQALAAVRDHALSRCVAAGAAPGSVRIESLAHAPVAYLPAGVHRVTVRAAGAPAPGATP
ncbi:hydantoinase/oxoprolinase family protein [Streptomyces hydrogenans]|uniref:hydantoinase/oxoprolinase family protein n=1 Tax=Streptomyces hydrogenans TaxID=1873719 RepID=UPI0036E660A3